MSLSYRVLGRIASGGMGEVLFAQRQDGRPVAVKGLRAHLAEDADAVTMFLDEARLASQIDHENVVRVHDVEMVRGSLVLVMDYVEGPALSTLLRTLRAHGTTLPVPIALRILTDALRGLHEAHELRGADGALLGVVHRDVSPQNLLVGSDGVTRITDFGIATAAGRLAATKTGGGIRGKLGYLSPEQILRQPTDRRTDVFAAGIVLWEALTGERLFSAGSEAEAVAQILRGGIAPPSTHREAIDLDVDEACLLALDRDRERRYETAGAFADALESIPAIATHAEVAALIEQEAADLLRTRREMVANAGLTPELDLEALLGDSVALPAPRPKPRMGVGPAVAIALAIGLLLGGLGFSFLLRKEAAQPPPPPVIVFPPPSSLAHPPPSLEDSGRAAGSLSTQAPPAAKPHRAPQAAPKSRPRTPSGAGTFTPAEP